jgi:type IV pilus assembly protein PilQ
MGKTAAAVVLMWLAAIAVGCASQKKGAPPAPDTGAGKIVGIVVESDADTDRIRILGNQPLTFTSVSKAAPPGVALYFPGTELSLEDAHMDLRALEKDGIVAEIKPSVLATDETTALIEIEVKTDAPYDVARQGDEVVVVFARPLHIPKIAEAPVAPEAEQEPKPMPAAGDLSGPAATRLEAVTVQRLENGVEIRVRADGPIKDYNAFTLAGPDRIVYDIFGVTSPYIREQTVEVGMPGVSRVRHYGDREKLRLVLDTTAEQFRATNARSIQDGLLIHVGDVAREDAAAAESTTPKTDSMAWIDRVDFAAEPTGKSVVNQADSKPLREVADNVGPSSASAMDTAATRERLPDTKQSDTRSFLLGQKTYVGEKIALDFYETDIKNVFRILGEVSGKNFAIDPDVRGTVTMSLDKPVPWDQVLDLVLRMNQLGQTTEGDVIRIATLETLKKEEEALQAAITARSNTLKSQEALEPLFTEIVDINYSKASVILPHIEDMMKEYGGDIDPVTGEKKSYRGFVRAYDATNQLVIRSTQSMLDRALDLVQRLDNPTPQVLIEARIVEATKSFSRDIGSEFGIGPGTGDKFSSSTLGGDWDLSLGSNFPAQTTTSGVSFDFSRLVGSPLAINAAIDASETEGETKTISAPKILTLDNKAATIKQGVSYPIIVLDEAGNTTTEFKDIVLELEVTPHVTKDDRVSMEIMITKNDLGERIGTDYSFTVNEATTELLVNDGETVVIGGSSKTTDTNSETGLPGLRKIPILGWLFGLSSKSNNKTELMIFITPRIVQLEHRTL